MAGYLDTIGLRWGLLCHCHGGGQRQSSVSAPSLERPGRSSCKRPDCFLAACWRGCHMLKRATLTSLPSSLQSA